MDTIKEVRQRFLSWFDQQNNNENDISIFDVKALYDAAYEEKYKARACMKTYLHLITQAEAMDQRYRRQIENHQRRLYGNIARSA